MNADLVPGGCQLSDQANQLGLWVCLQAATIHSGTVVSCYYYWNSLLSHRGWKAEST